MYVCKQTVVRYGFSTAAVGGSFTTASIRLLTYSYIPREGAAAVRYRPESYGKPRSFPHDPVNVRAGFIRTIRNRMGKPSPSMMNERDSSSLARRARGPRDPGASAAQPPRAPRILLESAPNTVGHSHAAEAQEIARSMVRLHTCTP